MKQSALPLKGQLNLPLLDSPVTAVAPSDERKELTVVLVELLIRAAQGDLETQPDGGDK